MSPRLAILALIVFALIGSSVLGFLYYKSNNEATVINNTAVDKEKQALDNNNKEDEKGIKKNDKDSDNSPEDIETVKPNKEFLDNMKKKITDNTNTDSEKNKEDEVAKEANEDFLEQMKQKISQDKTSTSSNPESTESINEDIVDSATADSDNDGLSDQEETQKYHTDPFNPDTDNDGYNDGDEVKSGYNPNGDGLLSDVNVEIEEAKEEKKEEIDVEAENLKFLEQMKQKIKEQ